MWHNKADKTLFPPGITMVILITMTLKELCHEIQPN